MGGNVASLGGSGLCVCLCLFGCWCGCWVGVYLRVGVFVNMFGQEHCVNYLLVVEWVLLLLALAFISVFGWVLGCVLDLLGLLRGCAAEILRRYGQSESFGDDYRSLFGV